MMLFLVASVNVYEFYPLMHIYAYCCTWRKSSFLCSESLLHKDYCVHVSCPTPWSSDFPLVRHWSDKWVVGQNMFTCQISHLPCSYNIRHSNCLAQSVLFSNVQYVRQQFFVLNFFNFGFWFLAFFFNSNFIAFLSILHLTLILCLYIKIKSEKSLSYEFPANPWDCEIRWIENFQFSDYSYYIYSPLTRSLRQPSTKEAN